MSKTSLHSSVVFSDLAKHKLGESQVLFVSNIPALAKTMSRIFIAILAALLQLLAIDCYYVEVELFEDGNCGGDWFSEGLDWMCLSMDSGISGLRIPIGSCAKMHKQEQCGGETYILAYPEYELCELPCCGWNDNVRSVEDCDTREVNIICPSGTFIREIEYAGFEEGFTIHCYKPNEDTPSWSENTHGNSFNNPDTTSCPIAAHGLSIGYDEEWQGCLDPFMECSRKFSAPPTNQKVNSVARKNLTMESFKPVSAEKLKMTVHLSENMKNTNKTTRHRTGNKMSTIQALCDETTALSGVQAIIDEAGVIKELFYFCDQVPDPTLMCEPQESLGTVLSCINDSENSLECKYSETIGVGESSTITETERKEMQFSAEFGFTVEGGIPSLSASMSATLGYSELVAFEWSQSDTKTWSKETTVEATITLNPYTATKIEQLVGKCSFYGANSQFFRATDMDLRTGNTTVRYFTAK